MEMLREKGEALKQAKNTLAGLEAVKGELMSRLARERARANDLQARLAALTGEAVADDGGGDSEELGSGR
jgi:hypothetical protein